MLKSNFGNRKKLVPTRKPTQMFGLKLGMQGLSFYAKIVSVGKLSVTLVTSIKLKEIIAPSSPPPHVLYHTSKILFSICFSS
jgi:hypothetical protein